MPARTYPYLKHLAKTLIMNSGRDHRIDFYRGLALIFIPGNPLANLTVRNFGFSDAAKIFVFLAGYAAVLAYGKIALRDGWPAVHDALMPRLLAEWLYPISKINLSPARLLHFLALAYVTAKLLPTGPWVHRWLAQQRCRMGALSAGSVLLWCVAGTLGRHGQCAGRRNLAGASTGLSV